MIKKSPTKKFPRNLCFKGGGEIFENGFFVFSPIECCSDAISPGCKSLSLEKLVLIVPCNEIVLQTYSRVSKLKGFSATPLSEDCKKTG